METVKITVKGAGSLEVENYDRKAIYDYVHSHLIGLEGAKVRKVMRGPRPKVKEQANG